MLALTCLFFVSSYEDCQQGYLAALSDGGVALARPGRTDEPPPAMLSQEAGGGQVYNERPGHLGVERPVITRQRLHRHNTGLFEATGEEPVSLGSHSGFWGHLPLTYRERDTLPVIPACSYDAILVA